MFGNFLNNFKKFGNQVSQLEINVSDKRREFMEVFERNAILEKEIVERTDELNQANKSVLTLQHIWKTMNSSEPLSEVLKTIIDGMGYLGYIHCVIFQIIEQDGEKILKVRGASENKFTYKIQEIIKEPLENIQISFNNESNILVNAIKSSDITSHKKLSTIFEGIKGLTDAEESQLDALLINKSISILPITTKEKPFGCLMVVSARNELCDTEKNFLSLFANQIELSVTIAGLFETIREQALTDPLTGVYNRRHFEDCLEREAERARRLNQPFSLITLDLDHLKSINDTYGHTAGDAAIVNIGQVLKRNARNIDIPSRFGGEEFGLVLPGIDVEGSLIAAERLRSAIEDTPVEGVGKITASIGVATFLKHTDDVHELFELCDQAMYKAKRDGRNQVKEAKKGEEANWQELIVDTFMDILSKNRIPIDKDTSNLLVERLKTTSLNNKNSKDFLFGIVDSFTQKYDPLHKEGNTEEKVRMAEKLAQMTGADNAEVSKIKMAAMVYDIGNMMLPEEILQKPGPLSDEEKQKVLEHPMIASKEILEPISSASNILSLVEHHHENWDGSGYPNKLAGGDIPLGSRILVVIDTYYALISDRSYRKAYSKEEAIKILKDGANVKWDGELVDKFVSILENRE